MSRTLAGVVMAGAAGVGAWQLPMPGAGPDVAALVHVLEVDHGIPAVAGRAYIKAAQGAPCTVDYRLPAAIGGIESGHGTHAGNHLDPATGVASGQIVSYAAANGPMQFIWPTWQRYATDGDGDGQANINDVDDAAASAVAYLCASNVDENLDDAIYAYNHDWGYVADVKARMVALPPLGSDVKVKAVDLSVLGANAEGLDGEFARRLAQLFAAAPAGIRINDGWRDPETQLALFNASDGSGTWVASAHRNADGSVTCGSNHCQGIAADLGYDAGIEEWAHSNAARFGLRYPMDYEPWHIELDPAAAAPQGAPAPTGGQPAEPRTLGRRLDKAYVDAGGVIDGACAHLGPGQPRLAAGCDTASKWYWGD